MSYDMSDDEDDDTSPLDLAAAGKRLMAFQGELDAGHFALVRTDAGALAEKCPPFAPIARVLEASAAWALGALDDADAHFTAIADSASVPRDLAQSAALLLATLDMERGRIDAATARLHAAREGPDALPHALALLMALSEARAAAMAGNIATAREQLETIRLDVEAQRDPRTRRAALMALALAWQACGDSARARDVFAQRLAEGDDAGALPEVLVRLARCEVALGHREEARSLLTRAATSGLESRYVGIARTELNALE